MNTPPEDVRSVLTELLRLYDWRFELARAEQKQLNAEEDGEDFNAIAASRKELEAQLRRYGREKKAAWEAARRVLTAVPSESGRIEELERLLARRDSEIAALIESKDWGIAEIERLKRETVAPSAELPRNYGLAVDDPALARIRELERELAVARSATALLCRREWVELKTCACRDDQCMRATDRTMPTP